MLNDEIILNSKLMRNDAQPKSKPPFVVSSSSVNNVNDIINSTSTIKSNFSKIGFVSIVNSKRSISGMSNRSIRVFKPETVLRANADASMASACGDLEWLKQSLNITTDSVYDKNVILLFNSNSNSNVYYKY
jgi:hypothetical protein